MSLFSVQNIKLSGISACVPKNEVSNLNIELLSPKERELLVKSVGIEKRRVAERGVCTSDLCLESAKALLKKLGWTPDEISVLIFITQTPDYITPATSSIIQDKLALPKGCISLDINLGCSGYVYGLAVASSLLNTLGRGKALLLTGDISTATISERDKSTVPIFSDAGSATAIEFSSDAAPMYFNLEGDGSGFETIIIPGGGYRNPVIPSSLEYKERGEGIIRNETHLILNGIDVFNFSVREVPENVAKLLEFARMEKERVNHFIFHQANMIINESIRKKLRLTKEQVPYSLRDFGNTSSATIPVTIITQLRAQIEAKPLDLVCCGFGVGLSWGSTLIHTNRVICPELIQS